MEFCKKCNNTGATGDADYLDCQAPGCDMATRRDAFNKWMLREGYGQSSLMAWSIYLHAARVEVEAASLLREENEKLKTQLSEQVDLNAVQIDRITMQSAEIQRLFVDVLKGDTKAREINAKRQAAEKRAFDLSEAFSKSNLAAFLDVKARLDAADAPLETGEAEAQPYDGVKEGPVFTKVRDTAGNHIASRIVPCVAKYWELPNGAAPSSTINTPDFQTLVFAITRSNRIGSAWAEMIAYADAHTAAAVAAERLAKENAIQQAQQHAMEARTQRGTVLDILRHFGCPENDWEALSLIKAAVAQKTEEAYEKGYAWANKNAAPFSMDLDKLARYKRTARQPKVSMMDEEWFFSCIDVLALAKSAREAQAVAPIAAIDPTVKQLTAQLGSDEKWTIAEQQAFAPFLAQFPNECSQGILSLGSAWKHGIAYAQSLVIAHTLPAEQGAMNEAIQNAFVTLESTEGRYSIVMKFNQSADAFAVQSYLLGVGGKEWNAAPQQHAQAALSDEQIGEAIQRGYSKNDGIRMDHSDLHHVVAELRAILATRQPAPVIEPEFSRDPDGDLCIDWSVGDKSISVSFNASGLVTWAIDGASGFRSVNQTAPVAAATQGDVLPYGWFDIDSMASIRWRDGLTRGDIEPLQGKPLFAESMTYQQGRAAGLEQAAESLENLCHGAENSAGGTTAYRMRQAQRIIRALNKGGAA